MNDLLVKEDIKIEKMIYEVRCKQVMLDSDLAILYQCSNGTKTINQATGRHKDRFPNDFYFQLDKNEYENLKSQIGTSKNKYGGIRKLPFVFTEEGVAMLSTIIRTYIASQMSIKIMRTFVEMRKYISSNLIKQDYINNQVLKNTEDIKILQESFERFNKNKIENEEWLDKILANICK